MCRLILFLVVSLFAFSLAIAQSPSPTPNAPPPQRSTAPNPIDEGNARFQRLRMLDLLLSQNGQQEARTHPLLDRKRGMYRKPSSKETRIMAVNTSLSAKYDAFLKNPHTGIVKLSAESSCASNAEVVVASEKCSNLSIPGAGTAYSFRFESYRMTRLADLMLLDGMIGADAVLQQYALVNLANVNIEETSLETEGMKYLVNLEPVRDGDAFVAFDAEIARGIRADGFLYRKGLPVEVGATYALRSIAFRAKYIRSIDGVVYDELDFDKRRDQIVAFQVIARDADGSVTIVWKRLKDAEAPKLEIKK